MGLSPSEDFDFTRGTLFKRKDFLEVEEAAKLHPARTYYYRKAASVDQLIEQSSRKLEEAPHNVKALAARAGGLARKKMYARAVEDYTAILALVPEDTNALYSRGAAYDKLGQTSDAIVSILWREPAACRACVAVTSTSFCVVPPHKWRRCFCVPASPLPRRRTLRACWMQTRAM